jgi:hypothetical protein
MNTFLIIAAVAAGGWILLIFGLKGMAVLLRKSAVKATKRALAGENILKIADNVSFLGADFPGPNLPLRTSGVLAVTDSRLIFLPWFPRRAITLPRDTISGVSLQDYYGEMAYNIPVLSLKVKGMGDPHGIMTWLTHEPQEWEKVIKSILG